MSSNQYENIQEDLKKFFSDWESFSKDDNYLSDPHLKAMATDIVKLYEDSNTLLKNPKLKEDAELAIYMLSTPWGAPFVADATLIEAAKSCLDESVEPLKHLLKDFSSYSDAFDNQLYCIFQDIQDDLNKD